MRSFNSEPNPGDIKNAPYKIRCLAVKRYLSDLENDKEVLKTAIEEIASNMIDGTISCNIDSMFYFFDTSEGPIFWSNIGSGLYNYYYSDEFDKK